MKLHWALMDVVRGSDGGQDTVMQCPYPDCGQFYQASHVDGIWKSKGLKEHALAAHNLNLTVIEKTPGLRVEEWIESLEQQRHMLRQRQVEWKHQKELLLQSLSFEAFQAEFDDTYHLQYPKPASYPEPNHDELVNPFIIAYYYNPLTALPDVNTCTPLQLLRVLVDAEALVGSKDRPWFEHVKLDRAALTYWTAMPRQAMINELIIAHEYLERVRAYNPDAERQWVADHGAWLQEKYTQWREDRISEWDKENPFLTETGFFDKMDSGAVDMGIRRSKRRHDSAISDQDGDSMSTAFSSQENSNRSDAPTSTFPKPSHHTNISSGDSTHKPHRIGSGPFSVTTSIDSPTGKLVYPFPTDPRYNFFCCAPTRDGQPCKRPVTFHGEKCLYHK